MSRKLIFVSGLLSCFSCQLDMARAGGHAGCQGREEECVECLRAFIRRKPLEIFAKAALHLAQAAPNQTRTERILSFAASAMTAYDKFLAILSDEDKRKDLKKLRMADVGSDRVFEEARAISHHFRDGIESFFFDGDENLAKLTRRYGVF
jgi:hypothetical protein